MKIQKLAKIGFALSTCLGLWIGAGSLWAAGKSCQRGLIVFTGQDAKGSIVFAMESTQSQGDRWDWTQASQAAWLFDEQQGWVKLKDRFGEPFKDNFGRRIGGGDWQSQFTNGFQPRMTLHSDANRILLAVKADRVVMQARGNAGQIMIANGEATFTWKERRIVGKIYLRNVLQQGQGASDIYVQNTRGMHREALYVAVGKQGFLSLVRTNEKSYAPLGGELSMSLQLDTLAGLATEVSMEATGYSRMGLYEYPTEWQGTFNIDGRAGMFKLLTFDYQTTEFLFFAGTRVAWARGFLNFDGESYPIYGMAEVEGRLQGKKQIQEAEWRARPTEEMTPGSSWEAIAH
jgi:hypothetical protein